MSLTISSTGPPVRRRALNAMEKVPIRKDYFESECGCRRWYESVPGGPVEELEEVVEYCEIHDIESGSA